MKKHLALLFLLLSTPIFAQVNLELSSTKKLHILEGTIDNKYPITMYLSIEEKTKKVEGKYYYNNIGNFILLKESVLDENSKVALKEFTNRRDWYSNMNSTGEFTGTLNKKMVFKGTWSNGKNSFDFEVKPNKNSIIQEIEIKKYTYLEHFNSNLKHPSFKIDYKIFQIVNPKKLAGIKKINEVLEKPAELADKFINDQYPSWKNHASECLYCGTYSWRFTASNELLYSDNNIITLFPQAWRYTGGAHSNGSYSSIIYRLDSGEVLKVTDLVYSVDDEKLLALMRQKLRDAKRGVYPPSDDKIKYFDFESIRLNDNYEVTNLGITFRYNLYEIAPRSAGGISISFTYEELKPFVKKDSVLWYLFE